MRRVSNVTVVTRPAVKYRAALLSDLHDDKVRAPALLTVEEAARVLRIGRTAAYELARRDLATGGGEGLRVCRVGRLLRVPRVALEDLVGGPFVIPGPGEPARSDGPPIPPPKPRPASRSRSADDHQASLPFEG